MRQNCTKPTGSKKDKEEDWGPWMRAEWEEYDVEDGRGKQEKIREEWSGGDRNDVSSGDRREQQCRNGESGTWGIVKGGDMMIDDGEARGEASSKCMLECGNVSGNDDGGEDDDENEEVEVESRRKKIDKGKGVMLEVGPEKGVEPIIDAIGLETNGPIEMQLDQDSEWAVVRKGGLDTDKNKNKEEREKYPERKKVYVARNKKDLTRAAAVKRGAAEGGEIVEGRQSNKVARIGDGSEREGGSMGGVREEEVGKRDVSVKPSEGPAAESGLQLRRERC